MIRVLVRRKVFDKFRFDGLPILLLADGLYPNNTVFNTCRRYGYRFINNIHYKTNTLHLVAKGAATPDEIISFREKYQIAASTLSVVPGFSRNTLSNIENEGVTSLASGRLIKMCLNNLDTMSCCVRICDAIDNNNKTQISYKLMQQGI